MGNNFNLLSCKTGNPQVQKFGYVDSVDSADPPVDLWSPGGILNDDLITPPASFVSTDATDAVAGNGMRSLRVEGVDSNGLFKTSDHNTNGLTPVNIGDYVFINRAYGLTWGSTSKNEGTINFTDSIATVMSQIAVGSVFGGFGQTLQAIFCIPLDWGEMVFLNWYASLGRQAATQGNIILTFNKHRFFDATAGFRVSNTFEVNAQGTTFANNPIIPSCSTFKPLSIIRMTVTEVTTNSTRFSGGFGLGKTGQ